MKHLLKAWSTLLITPFFLVFPGCRAENPPGGDDEHERPVTVGEFGALVHADPQSRVRWTK